MGDSKASANGTSKKNGVVVPRTNGKVSYSDRFKLADHFIGGNKLDNAPASKVKEFVASHDGHTVITNVQGPFPNALPPTQLSAHADMAAPNRC